MGVAEGRGIWEDIMTRHGKEAEYWMDYITYIRHREGADVCRKLFRQAVNSVTDSPERMCDAYIQFEREEGTLESFEAAITRTQSQMGRLKERREKAAEKEAQAKEELKKKRKSDKKAQKKGKAGGKPPSEDGPHPQQQQDTVGSTAALVEESQRSQGSAGQRKRPAAHVFFKDSDEEDTWEGVERKKPKVSDDEEERVPPASGLPVGVAPVVAMETDKPEKVESAGEGPKEKRTVFVSNLPAEVTDVKLREKFSECGEMLDVRVVHSRARSNRTNTFAYIEFASPASVGPALSLDRTPFMDKNLYVSPFKEKGEQPAAFSRRTERMNKMTVFVKNLQKDISEERLKVLFAKCGEVKEVRIVKNMQGRSKGFAYIEFTKESSAVEAVEKLNSHLLGLKRIQVAISNPPSAKKPPEGGTAPTQDTTGGVTKEEFARPTFVPQRALQKQSEDVPLANRRKTNVSLMPRVLAKRGGAGEVKGQVSSDAGGAKMSNEDFRKLFSKQ